MAIVCVIVRYLYLSNYHNAYNMQMIDFFFYLQPMKKYLIIFYPLCFPNSDSPSLHDTILHSTSIHESAPSIFSLPITKPVPSPVQLSPLSTSHVEASHKSRALQDAVDIERRKADEFEQYLQRVLQEGSNTATVEPTNHNYRKRPRQCPETEEPEKKLSLSDKMDMLNQTIQSQKLAEKWYEMRLQSFITEG